MGCIPVPDLGLLHVYSHELSQHPEQYREYGYLPWKPWNGVLVAPLL